MTQKQVLNAVNRFCNQCWDFKREGACEGKMYNMDGELIGCPLHSVNNRVSKGKLLKKIREHCLMMCCNESLAVVWNCQEAGNESECCLYKYRIGKKKTVAVAPTAVILLMSKNSSNTSVS